MSAIPQVQVQAEAAANASPANGLMSKLPSLLRVLGACAVVVALYSFVVRGWQNGNDVARYFMLLGHTGLLAALGLVSGHWLQEGKGARLLLSLALVSVPANFAILGAFIYSQTSAVEISRYPEYLAWSVDSLSTALISSGVALLVLIPAIWLGFAVLARNLSARLGLLFLISNLALLAPLRDPQGIALLVIALTLLVLGFGRYAVQHQVAAKTYEGMLALVLQLLPIGMLLGRTLWLYAFDLFLASVVAGTVYVALRQSSLLLQRTSGWRALLDALALVPALSLLALVNLALQEIQLLPTSLNLPIASLLSATLVWDIARRNVGASELYRGLAGLIVMLGLIGNLLLFNNFLAALVCLLSGATLLTWAYQRQRLAEFNTGLVLLLAGLLQQIIQLIVHFDLSSWVGLATLGIIAILFASILDARGGRLRQWWLRWRQHWQTQQG